MAQESSLRESPGLEDYLEAIGHLSRDNPEVGVTEISQELNVKKPSVTSAVKRLKQKNLVEHEAYGPVVLTKKGKILADEVSRRHEVLFQFFTNVLEIDEEIADEDACRIEHYVSEKTLEKISTFVDFLLSCPRGKPVVIENFAYYANHGKRSEEMRHGCDGFIEEE